MERKNKSVVWMHFIKLSRDSAKCTLCSNTLKCTSSTTNLKEHLKRKHPLHVNKSVELVDPDDPVLSNSPTINTASKTVPVTFKDDNIQSSFTSSIQLNRSRQLTLIPTDTTLPESKKKKLDLLIIKMICKDLQTLSIVENEGFKELISELEPRYILPSRRTITRNFLPDLYETTKGIVRNTLNEVKYVSLTTDIWSSINVQSFITVTAHFIHNDKLCSYVLETCKLSANHTVHNIACVLNNIFEQWCIRNKICAIVTDGGTNITSACKDHLQINHLPCNAHVINLVAKNAVKKIADIKEILQKCRKIVEHFKSSSTAMERLRSMQQQMGCPVLKLKQDILTRWNSTLLMIERLIKIKEPLSATLGVLNRPPESLNEDEWNNLHDFVLLLKPLEQITIELSCEKYVSLSKIIPLVRGFQTLLKDIVVSSEVALQLKNKIINEFNNRFGMCERDKIPSVSTLLDPRFKVAAFDAESNVKTDQEVVLSEMKMMFQDDVLHIDTSSSTHKQQISKELWNFLDVKVAHANKHNSPASNADVQLQQYLSLPYENREICPIRFWAKQKLIMPQLADIALKYLCIPATSVPSERLFSKAGQLVSEQRNRLDPKNIDLILFLNSNL